MTQVPMEGGSVTEGILGTPRFVNPALATTDADRDLVSLIYSGLMRKNTSGGLINDIAREYQISEDGLAYTFELREDIIFHDGENLDADDVIFTINTIKDPVNKSPEKSAWDGVTVEKLGPYTVVFTLRQAYTSFLDNATIGIMPEHIWSDSPIELNEANMSPVGSGPYQVKNVSKQSSGIIDQFSLTSFKEFSFGRPYIRNINLKFYQNEEDLVDAVESSAVSQISSISPEKAKILEEEGYRVESLVLPRVFGLFFNQNQNQVFINKSVIEAIDEAVDKDRIVREVLFGYGVAIEDPVPPNMLDYQKLEGSTVKSRDERLANALAILEKDGWQKNENGVLQKQTEIDKQKTTQTLSFSISTGSAPELAETADMVKRDLEALGMQVDIKTFETANLNQIVIRPRKYESLFFGQIINHESDLFAFWHSSQRKDPGLNVAMYTNARVDKILEEAFVTTDKAERVKKYSEFEEEIRKDKPAVFVYSPSFIYVVNKDLKGFRIDHITSPGDRFLNVHMWYTKTDNVWKIFSK